MRPRNLQEFYCAISARGFNWALGSFLDEFRANPSVEALADPPSIHFGPYHGAFCAAMAETLAVGAGMEPPAWVHDPLYVLSFDQCEEVKGLAFLAQQERDQLMHLIAGQTPEPFRRRRILIRRSALSRV
jgi:hypothetical protein